MGLGGDNVAVSAILFLLSAAALAAFIAGLINPRLVIRWGRRRTRVTSSLLFGFLTIALLGASGETANALIPSTPSTNETTAKQPHPMSQAQLLSILRWTNQEYSSIHLQYLKGLGKHASPSFMRAEGAAARALTKRGDSISHSMPTPIPSSPYNVWWWIESDVNTTTNFALSAVSDMGLIASGDGAKGQLQQDLKAYEEEYKKVLYEVQHGKLQAN